MTLRGPVDRTSTPCLGHKPKAQMRSTRAPQGSDGTGKGTVDTIRTHLARFLLAHASSGRRPSRHWTQPEIAAQIGTARDVLRETLHSLAREGLIRRERGRLVVTDVDRLRREAVLR